MKWSGDLQKYILHCTKMLGRVAATTPSSARTAS
jgi:hypothetical protein